MRTIQFNKDECNRFIYYTVYKFWLWLLVCNFNKPVSRNNSRVYDSLGLIDTLGFNSDKHKFTYNYSDEFVYLWGFSLKFINIEFIES
jgi:hypothetical protein